MYTAQLHIGENIIVGQGSSNELRVITVHNLHTHIWVVCMPINDIILVGQMDRYGMKLSLLLNTGLHKAGKRLAGAR